jgi:hypothetical protein
VFLLNPWPNSNCRCRDNIENITDHYGIIQPQTEAVFEKRKMVNIIYINLYCYYSYNNILLFLAGDQKKKSLFEVVILLKY